MSIPNLSIQLSSDGTYITVKDLTPISEYTGIGVDLTTDLVSVILTMTDPSLDDYDVDITSVFLSEVRESSGTIIEAGDFTSYLGDLFPDGQYTFTVVLTEDSTGSNEEHEVESDYIFISQISQIVMSQIKEADWKYIYDPYDKRISIDLRKRFYLLDIKYSSENGLLDEAEEVRLALNKLCGYDG